MGEIVEKFKYLVKQAEYFQKIKDDENFLFEEIDKIPTQDIETIKALYANEEKIKKIRYETCTLLLEDKFNQQSFEKLKKKINDEYETNILHSWKNFSILYVFFFYPIKDRVNQYLEAIGNYLLEESLANLKLKTTNFDGVQNFGETRCWLALYNPKYSSQSEGIQYFINFSSNNLTYGTYEHKSKKDYHRTAYDKKDINDELLKKMIADLKKQLPLILEDTKYPKNKESSMSITQPLNQILYGPPGTGKTYHTINKALEIIDGVVPEERDEAKAKFEEYKKAGQIEFITFHQSYGYEEFVEGIKAKTTEKGIEYKIESSVFKKLSKLAKENYDNSQKSLEKLIQEKSLQQKIEQFLNDSLENQRAFTKTKGGKFKIKDIRDTSIIVFTEDSNYSENILELDIGELFKILDSEVDFKTSRQLAKDVFGINNQRQKDTYYFSMYREFQKQKFDIVEEEKVKESLKNHILIIDEINRGNISKIFGELITLIEPSKRIGADEEIRVRLPYSGDEFGVPQNLYIIGTMNTADRSIALIDTALRRRFEFSEMMPNPELLDFEIDAINLKSLLETINKRVEYLFDRDHTIGHAYFIDVKSKDELDSVMKNKILPLLQEYFYDDWEKIRLVLNEGFISKTIQKSDIFDDIGDDYIEDEKYIYAIAEEFSYEAYLKLCKSR